MASVTLTARGWEDHVHSTERHSEQEVNLSCVKPLDFRVYLFLQRSHSCLTRHSRCSRNRLDTWVTKACALRELTV